MVTDTNRHGRSCHIARRRRAFTLSEILIAATLSMVFAGLIAQTIATGVRVSTDTGSRVIAETRAREVFRTTTAALRGATPLGQCVEPSTAGYLDCKIIATRPYPIVYAAPDRIYFFAQRSTAADGSTAPDLVRLAFTVDSAQGSMNGKFGTLTVSRWFPPSGDFVRPPWPWLDAPCSADCSADIAGSAPGQDVRIGVVDGNNQPVAVGTGCVDQRKVLSYFDSSGSELLPSTGCRLSAQDLQRIALIVVDTNISYDLRGRSAQTFKLSAAVAIAAVNYAEVAQ